MVEPAPARPGIFVATPVYGAACYMPYVTGLLSLQKICAEAGIGFDYFYVSGTALLHEHRNVAAAAFMRHSDLSHMLYVDADIGFDGADILRMFVEQREVVLGPYPAKHINWHGIVETARQNRTFRLTRSPCGWPITARTSTAWATGPPSPRTGSTRSMPAARGS